MPDIYAVEYEFVDTMNGTALEPVTLRYWPCVMFAQAIDYSHNVK